MQRIYGLVWPIVLSVVLPLVVAWFAYPETHLPSGLFAPLFVDNPPGFNPVIFVALALVEAAIVLFLLFPQWFGFTIPTPPPKPTAAAFPVWRGADAVFLVVDVGAGHALWRLSVLRLHAFVVGLHPDVGRAGISP